MTNQFGFRVQCPRCRSVYFCDASKFGIPFRCGCGQVVDTNIKQRPQKSNNETLRILVAAASAAVLLPTLLLTFVFVIWPALGHPSLPAREYKIISDTKFQHYKRSVDIRLERKMTSQELAAIAERVKSIDRANYDRTFIGYYLPGMKVDSGYWATTHYNPELEIRIIGSQSN